jgi:hypothetical protein
MQRTYETPRKTFSGWYLSFLVLALLGIVLFICWNLAHPPRVH